MTLIPLKGPRYALSFSTMAPRVPQSETPGDRYYWLPTLDVPVGSGAPKRPSLVVNWAASRPTIYRSEVLSANGNCDQAFVWITSVERSDAKFEEFKEEASRYSQG